MDKALVIDSRHRHLNVNTLKEILIFVVIATIDVINIDSTDRDVETGGWQGLGLGYMLLRNRRRLKLGQPLTAPELFEILKGPL